MQYHNNGIYLFLLTVISQHGLQIEGLGYDNFGGRRHAVVVTGSDAWLVQECDLRVALLAESRDNGSADFSGWQVMANQEYSVASLYMKNLMYPTPLN